jgi:hypothetical protein
MFIIYFFSFIFSQSVHVTFHLGTLFAKHSPLLPASCSRSILLAPAPFFIVLCLRVYCSSAASVAGSEIHISHRMLPQIWPNTSSRELIAAAAPPALHILAQLGSNSLHVMLNSHVTRRQCLGRRCCGVHLFIYPA